MLRQSPHHQVFDLLDQELAFILIRLANVFWAIKGFQHVLAFLPKHLLSASMQIRLKTIQHELGHYGWLAKIQRAAWTSETCLQIGSTCQAAIFCLQLFASPFFFLKFGFVCPGLVAGLTTPALGFAAQFWASDEEVKTFLFPSNVELGHSGSQRKGYQTSKSWLWWWASAAGGFQVPNKEPKF